jgi:hypothetical protein
MAHVQQIAREKSRESKKNFRAIHAAKEVQLRAERKAGEILRDMEKAKGGRPSSKTGNSLLPVSTTYKELGIEKMEASRWQKIAEILEEEFEAARRKGCWQKSGVP